jgi:signal transduction histidine kinase
VRAASPRALVAAGLLTALTGALLVAWFVSGWADVRARQHAVREAPQLAAEQRGAELAHELRGELGAVLAREVDRPYFHYQNLFHDPRASAGLSVAPSPLAHGPDDALVLGYFQLDARGRATTPTINDELPELSEPRRYADNARFRDEVTRSLAGALAPPAAGPLVAALTPAAPGPHPPPPARRDPPAVRRDLPPPRPEPAVPRPEPAVAQQEPAQAQQAPPALEDLPQARQALPPIQQQQAQVVTLDRNTYSQNSLSNGIYARQQRVAPQQAAPVPQVPLPSQAALVPQVPLPSQRTQLTSPVDDASTTSGRLHRVDPPSQASPAPESPAPESPAPESPAPNSPASAPPPPRTPRPAIASRPRVAPRAPQTAPAEPSAPVAITVSPLEWRTLAFSGLPAIVAVRQVDTPDGKLAQGFVIDRTALTSWLAGHAGDAVAELRTGDNGSTEIVPGWHLEVAANPRALVAAAADAGSLARGFIARFSAAGVVAILAALLVVLLVAHAERLARERSQFAAAAAHELRTPLAGLQLYGDMLADGLGDPGKLRDYARRMSEEASRLGRVVSNVLGFSQLERGNLSVDARPGDLAAALRELAERAQPALDRAGAVLALELAPELAATFDRDALARIVGNLLDNAEKYSRASDDRTITLAARATATAVEVSVSDRGPGIEAPARARLFRPFARGVSSDGPAGLGLGLALSQSLARAMGGTLIYRPVPDGGAAFVLSLAPA